MKYEEYEAIAKQLTTENAPDIVKQMLDAIKEDVSTIDTLMSSITEKDTKIRDLQDTNLKLFLSQTGKADDASADDVEEEMNKEVETAIDDLLKGV